MVPRDRPLGGRFRLAEGRDVPTVAEAVVSRTQERMTVARVAFWCAEERATETDLLAFPTRRGGKQPYLLAFPTHRGGKQSQVRAIKLCFPRSYPRAVQTNPAVRAIHRRDPRHIVRNGAEISSPGRARLLRARLPCRPLRRVSPSPDPACRPALPRVRPATHTQRRLHGASLRPQPSR